VHIGQLAWEGGGLGGPRGVCMPALPAALAAWNCLLASSRRRTLAPLSTRYFRVGTAARMRVSSVMFRSASRGTCVPRG
jgi:hypothetical protein